MSNHSLFQVASDENCYLCNLTDKLTDYFKNWTEIYHTKKTINVGKQGPVKREEAAFSLPHFRYVQC